MVSNPCAHAKNNKHDPMLSRVSSGKGKPRLYILHDWIGSGVEWSGLIESFTLLASLFHVRSNRFTFVPALGNQCLMRFSLMTGRQMWNATRASRPCLVSCVTPRHHNIVIVIITTVVNIIVEKTSHQPLGRLIHGDASPVRRTGTRASVVLLNSPGPLKLCV